jgi:hypothetical protein
LLALDFVLKLRNGLAGVVFFGGLEIVSEFHARE